MPAKMLEQWPFPIISFIRNLFGGGNGGLVNVPVMTIPQPPGTRISGAVASAAGGGLLNVRLFYHPYV